MIKKKYFSIVFISSFLFLFSCQKNELLQNVNFDNSLLNKVNINAEKKAINILYETTFNEPYIDHVMEVTPTIRIFNWLENNINNFGTENYIIIDIQNASIIREEINREITVAGVIKKKNDYVYKLNFDVLYVLYDDNNQVLATAKSNVFRSTTSSKFISLNERNKILDNLTFNSLKDLSNKSSEVLKKHMSEYIL
tara:strand:- start:907 stop:1494 length:588 start_codon:yes stop_codon:yes gene_type:complete